MGTPLEIIAREQLNKTLQILSSGPLPFDELMILSGLDNPSLARTIHQLKKSDQVFVVDKQVGSEKKAFYSLTDIGKQAAPPKYVKDLAKFEAKTTGYKHVHGIVGKVDLSKPLRGALDVLYTALNRPMTVQQWASAANMVPNHVYTYIEKLSGWGIVNFRMEKNANGKEMKVYYRAREMQTVSSSIKEPPKPKLEPATVKNIHDLFLEKPQQETIAPIPPPPEGTPVISNFSKPNIALDEALKELGERFSTFEIVLGALAQLEPEYKDLLDLRARVKKQFGEFIK